MNTGYRMALLCGLMIAPSVWSAQDSVDIRPLPSPVEIVRPLERTTQPLRIDGPRGELPRAPAMVRTSPTHGRTASEDAANQTAKPTERARHSPSLRTPSTRAPRATRSAHPPKRLTPPGRGIPASAAATPSAATTALPTGRAPDPRSVYDADVARSHQAHAEGRTQDAIDILLGRWDEMVAYGDTGSLGALAYWAADVGDEALAVRAARQAAELGQSDRDHAVLANVLIRFGRLDEAQQVLAQMDPNTEAGRAIRGSLAVHRAQIHAERGDWAAAEAVLDPQRDGLDDGAKELLGWVKYRLDRLDEAAQLFAAVYGKTRSESSAQGLVFSLHRLQRHDALLQWVQRDNDSGPLSRLVAPPIRLALAAGSPRLTVAPDGQLSLANDTAAVPPPAEGGWQMRIETVSRHKRGVAGEGRLTQHIPATTLSWQGFRDRLSLRIEAQSADDGSRSTQGIGWYGWWQRDLGGGWSTRLGLGRASVDGVAGLGSARPLLGEIGIRYDEQRWGVGLSLARQPVQESLLALSGKPASGDDPAWGQVVQTGLTISGRHRLQDWAISLSATAASITGTGVASNRKFELYARALKPVAGVPSLQMGPELLLSSFQRNLNAYRPGHGGYFSPRAFAQVGWLAIYDPSWQGLQWHIEGGIGYNWNQQASAADNPLTGTRPDAIAASRGQGWVYRLLVDASRPIGHQWKLGAWVELQKAANYRDGRVGLYASGALD